MSIIAKSAGLDSGIPLSRLVEVRRRYLRSVHLERDFYDPRALDGYILTPAGIETSRRITAGINDTRARALSVTGAYGTGKSAFALFLSHLLATPDIGDSLQRVRLSAVDPESREHLSALEGYGYWPVLVTGTRQPVGRALVQSVLHSLSQSPVKAAQKAAAELRAKWLGLIDDKAPETARVVEFLAEASRLASRRHNKCRGLLVIVDELGKMLEYAATYPEASDLQVLQELAEYASRSDKAPLILVTVLHQAFEEYAQRLSRTQRAEWQKVQGRFNDIPFGDGPTETLRLIGEAVHYTATADTAPLLEELTSAHLSECQRLRLVPGAFSTAEFRALLWRTYPLHPLALLALPHVFRRFGQNQRSLFSFLTSDEPHGFNSFLRSHYIDGHRAPVLGIAELYDFVVANFGSSLYSHSTGKLWSETEEALYRARETGPLHIRLIKTIGLLSVLGEQTRMLPSREMLEFALGDADTRPEQVYDAIKALESATLITYRRHRDAYRLYEGSDVDVEARQKEARAQLTAGVDPVQVARRLGVTSPIVARRHSFRTGTLRFFEVAYCRVSQLLEEVKRPLERTDGRLVLCLAADPSDLRAAEQHLVPLISAHPEVIFGINLESDALQETAVDVESLVWVQENTPELRNDRVAAREVGERLVDAEEAFRFEWDRMLRPQSTVEGGCIWYYRGERQYLDSFRDLQALVSRACDETYPQTPSILNELVNRRQLSSTAAAARRNLIEGMIERQAEEQLGIDGFPPELSMYHSLLGATGIHRRGPGGEWLIQPPAGDDALRAVWDSIESLLFNTSMEAVPLTEFIGLLRSRPFGLTDGLIPVLVCAVLVCFAAEVALYEEGRFVPDLTTATFERMIKHPEDYKLQGFRIAGERQAVIEGFARGMGLGDEPTLVRVVQHLYRQLNRLPEYTLKTKTLTDAAAGVRDLLKDAKQPEQLLFVELPLALGVRPLGVDSDSENVAEFFSLWNETMAEVLGAYPGLLLRVENRLKTELGARDLDQLRTRAGGIMPFVAEPRLRAFCVRAADLQLPREKWIESVAAAVIGRPPFSWSDAEEERFGIQLASVGSAFNHAELLRFEKKRAAGELHTGLRISVTQDTGEEDARVVLVSEEEQPRVEKLTRDAIRLLEDLLKGQPTLIRLAVIGQVTQQTMRGDRDA